MISKEQIATIRRLYYAEHWKVGTIAAEMTDQPPELGENPPNASTGWFGKPRIWRRSDSGGIE